MRDRTSNATIVASLLVLGLVSCADQRDHPADSDPTLATVTLGDAPAIERHLAQADIEAGAVSIAELIDHGEMLFRVSPNNLDGACRPNSTGTGSPRATRGLEDDFNRLSGPDSNACAGCHNQPRIGGAGDNVANVFVLAQRLPFVNFDGGSGDGNQTHTLATVGNERNTVGMFGSGFVELLAREMTVELHAIRDEAIAATAAGGVPTTLELVAKGVHFGTVTALPGGQVDVSGVEGVDSDLVVRPFHQKGAVVSLREFTNNATNHHHGMQTSERFGDGVDADGDGIANELTEGDVTALTVFQATLPAPGRVTPRDAAAATAASRGEEVFSSLGCATCHVPALRLDSPNFTEPSPFNPEGNLRPADTSAEVVVDLTREGPGPWLSREANGAVMVPLFSDLKRHDMGRELDTEALEQSGIPTAQWLTRKLWGIASEGPFLHHGRATLLSEAITAHGGEGQASRDAYVALSADDRAAVVEFLKTLQVLPETSEIAPATTAIGDAPAVAQHTSQVDVDAGQVPLDELLRRGQELFAARFNTLDGAGRPESTGTGAARLRRDAPANFNRLSAPDSDSCAGCHNLPRIGGGGDNVANVFVLAQRLSFVNFDGGEGDGFVDQTLKGVGNERNTLGMFGSGFIELLAREMTSALHALRSTAMSEAVATGSPVRVELEAKGVRFGSLTAMPSGVVDTAAVEGVDADLIIKPFHQKGAVISLRQFTNNAMNHHHGMQAMERFGGGTDPDGDGHVNELTEGDITAITLFQATLPVPGRVLPRNPTIRAAVERGETRFVEIGCATCHVPALRLDNPVFVEPNPYNPDGNLQPGAVGTGVAADLTRVGPTPHLARAADGSVSVPAFTDLKRHDLGSALDNEQLEQDGIPTQMWLTRKLWGMANEPPFLHNGRALLFGDAILQHGGEAQESRDRYEALTQAQKDEIIAFLKTLQVLPVGSPSTVVEQ